MNIAKSYYIARARAKTKKGFALVLALALMGFMVLLVVTLSTMVQMQLRLSKQTLTDFKAKQAAKFAAYQAMSQIQSTLGPDQRITANAKMFDDSVSTEITRLDESAEFDWWSTPAAISREDERTINDVSISQNRYWVGVWESALGKAPEKQKKDQSRSDYVTKTINKALTWLVSGNSIRDEADTEGTTIAYKPNIALEDGKYVRAVSSGSYVDSEGTVHKEWDVLAPIVTLDDDPDPLTGEVRGSAQQKRIAWWVSDEGQKACLNAVASRDALVHAERIDYRIQSLPFYSGIHGLTVPNVGGKSGVKAFDLLFDDGDDDVNSIAKIRNLDDVKQLDIIKSASVPDTTEVGKFLFHDVTFNTKGLLVNVREGGLKKDLSLGLTRTTLDNEPETITNAQTSTPSYFERPYGVGGYDYKQTAYPLLANDFYVRRRLPSNAYRKLKGKGHIFGPQMAGHEDMNQASVRGYDAASAIAVVQEIFGDNYLWKDPGGPLWDQLRSYYNLRAENSISRSSLDDRLQTDDRVGLKPVVKRFQVFYVPTFVNYGSNRYGLRLHIMPLLILYNPYDTKINGDSYYAIRLRGYRNTHPVGGFRFAIGYERGTAYGQRFQCLRDLRTELMPSFGAGTANNSNVNYVTGSGTSNYQQFYFPFARDVNWTGTVDQDIVSGSLTKETSLVPQYMLSKYTGFYSTQRTRYRMYPLGYGEVAPSTFTRTSTNTYEHWKGIVAAGNIVPSMLTDFDRNAGSMWSARVAKIPLYLNNLYAIVCHGTQMNMDYNTKLFRMQRFIDGVDHNSISVTSYGISGDLHFLAYDAKGIEPGKAKIFSMTQIISYMGNPRTNAGTNENGPGGQIELTGSDTSPYENRKAMLRGLDDGGKLGGCFFIDVPHGEAEHQFKFTSGITWDYKDYNTRYVIFDLNKINANRNNLIGIDGSPPPTSISEYRIDMQDLVGSSPDSIAVTPYGGTELHVALYAKPNVTPIGYAIWTYSPDYAPQNWYNSSTSGFNRCSDYFLRLRRSSRYTELELDIWMWKREGFKFETLSKYDNNYKNRGNLYPEQAPELAYFKGYRVFIGEHLQSFPDPTVSYSSDLRTWMEGYARNNYHTVGTAGYGMNLVSLRAFNAFGDTDSSLEADGYNKSTEANEYLILTGTSTKEEARQVLEANGGTVGTSDLFRSRYYLNWLGINPRRHSANSWETYKGYPNADIFTSSGGDICDLAPRAMRGDLGGSLIPNRGSYGYESSLHGAINNTTGVIPYGLVFSLPYAQNEEGSQPFFNRRMFVNGTILATAHDSDFSARNMTSQARDTLTNDFGRFAKQNQAISQVYGTMGDGLTNVGYNVMSPDQQHVRVGLRPQIGTLVAPIHHILRKTEVVSNPANLSSANLNFGVGRGTLATERFDKPQNSTEAKHHPWFLAYGMESPEALNAGFAIGNSLAHMRISPERSYQVMWLDGCSRLYYLYDQSNNGASNQGNTDGKRENTWYEDRHVLYDYSWHLNNMLWDEYFFSTLPYRQDERENTLDPAIAYPQNPRLVYCKNDSQEYIQLSDLSGNNEDQFTENASKLWVKGAFNVNSTNVDAWKAILSTYYGGEVMGYDGTTYSDREKAPFLRWAAPYKAISFSGEDSMDDEDTWMQGYRALSDDEIEELAIAIVENIKDRGPFYSMSHFVNRVVGNYSAEERYTDSINEGLIPQPGDDDDRIDLEKEYDGEITYRMGHAQKGVLQAAIDSTSINSPFHTDPDFTISVGNDRNMSNLMKSDKYYKIFRNPKDVWENWRAAIGPQATGAPCYLMQQDILSRLGSIMTVRSDTFKIRAYGEVRNPVSNVLEGKAWCEMVVQRLPEYIDQTTENQEAWRVSNREIELGCQDGAQTDKGEDLDSIMDELSDLNKALGRRFKIVSFRWLNEKEI